MSIAEIHPDDPDDEWLVEDAGRTLRVRYLTAALVVLALLGGGFWGGVIAEKHHGSSSTSAAAGLASRFAAARAAAGAGAGAGAGGAFTARGSGAGGLGGGVTAGTVIGVQGDVLDISDTSGNIVKVTVGPSVSVTRTAKTDLSALQIGDTVVVTGSPTDPTAVRATASGAGSAGGAFARPGGSVAGGTGLSSSSGG